MIAFYLYLGREWHHHHPPPITPKQFGSIEPTKKNLTPLRRSNASSSQSIPEKKCESKEESTAKKIDIDSSVKKEKEAKEEKNEKIKNETIKESEKHTDNKFDQPHFEKSKSFSKDNIKKSDSDSVVDSSKKDLSLEDKEKLKSDKDKHELSRNEQSRDRRRDGRERGGVNSRSRGGSTPVAGNQLVGANVSNRYESSRGRGGSNNRSGSYGGSNVQPGNVSTGSSSYRGKKEYRRSRVERGPRFDRQKNERDKDKTKDDKKDKHSDDTSCSEVDDSKIGHLRQKDEDSEVSVDEASASTTESAQAEKYQGTDCVQEEDKGFVSEQPNSVKDSVKSEKYKKEKKDNRIESSKPYETDKLKDDKGGFAPRGEPSRRGRGGGGTLSFRNSRGGSRHGPSSYGPPPSRAGFGGHKQEKSEEQKIAEETFAELNQQRLNEYKSNMPPMENVSAFPKESNKSRSLERPQQRRPGRYDNLPPRFQKRQDRRYEKFDQSFRGRGRGRSGGYQGSGNPLLNKMGQGGKENLSDVANEEWETASESSDVAERKDRHDEKDDSRKKESHDKGSSATRKSFSSQRPVNDGAQGRRGNDPRRGGGQGNTDKSRQKDNFSRETRPRDSGRNRQGNYSNSDRRVVNSNGNNSRPSSSAGHASGRNNGRNPSTKTGAYQPKSEGTATVYRVDEIKLQDPNGVQAALTDLTNR